MSFMPWGKSNNQEIVNCALAHLSSYYTLISNLLFSRSIALLQLHEQEDIL